jgi:hypothetical protein
MESGYEYRCWSRQAVWVGFEFGPRGKVKGNIKSNVKGNGQECPFHTCKSNIKGNVKSDGQECPSHTNKGQVKSKTELRSATGSETRSYTCSATGSESRSYTCFDQQAAWGAGGDDVYG